MPEVKNTFIQSKMNKDMDGRILPNGQYRDGRNVQISRSEGDDVGALETVLGNNFKTNFGLNDDSLVAIGKLRDDTSDSIYLFLTNYTDCSYDELSNPSYNAEGVNCYIVKYDIRNNLGTVLVEGNFLNFSTTHLITGVNLLENLLFWTDNRNQPRKINIKNATPGYYTSEDQISVSKYYPYEPISLLNINTTSTSPSLQPPFESTMLDTTSEYLPIHTAAKVKSIDPLGTVPRRIDLDGYYDNIKMNTPGFAGNDGNLVTGIALNTSPVIVDEALADATGGPGNGVTRIEIVTPHNPALVDSVLDDLNEGDILYFQFLNPDYLPAWPGDPDYLKNRFVRFSYRFKFEDEEYSLAAPFTQIAFVPRQDGYFIGDKAPNATTGAPLIGQESATFDTTVVDFMQNKITDITLRLLAPTENNLINAPQYSGSSKAPEYMNWNEVESKLKIKEIEILYKEADSNKVSVLETLTLSDFGSTNSENFYYNYQSRKPWKTVVPNQTTWVSSRVPVKALSQEVAGNRIIYGDYVDKHSSPFSLNYTLQIGEKPIIPDYQGGGSPPSNLFSSVANVRKEYQNHTLKQNRTYQVGIVLSDRYGRSSNVILSSVQLNNLDPEIKGSTIFHTYKNPEDEIIQDKYTVRYTVTQDPTTWPGDMLRVTFDNAIPKAKNNTGYPGVYSVDDGSVSSIAINLTSPSPPFDPALVGCVYDVVIENGSGATAQVELEVDALGNLIVNEILDGGSGWINGEYFSITSWGGVLPACQPASWPTMPDVQGIVFTPNENPLGWYSYKIVVKQQQQEYYNVYLPGSLAGYPCEQNIVNHPPFNITTITSDETMLADDQNKESSDYANSTTGTNVDEVFGAIPSFVYPDSQYRNTAHIVLFSDNINKVPRDLQELGPLQDEFRSGEELFIRVESILLDEGSGNEDTYSSKQYKPNVLGDKVIAIASMEKLKLGDLTTSPAFPVIPNLFYKGDTNPLIARIETEDIFGIYKTESGNKCDAEYGRPPDAPHNDGWDVVRNTTYSYGPTLAVAETKPVESLLDIFWETTTAGLIQQLNYDIENSDNTIPSGLTEIDITWSEADNYGAVISNDFQAAGPTGNPLGAGVIIELVNVEDGIGTPRTNGFDLNSLGAGEYNISLSDCSLGGCPGWLCWEDPAKNIWFFTFKLTDVSTGLVQNFEATGYVFNREPNDRGATDFSDAPLTTNLQDFLRDKTCDPLNSLGYDNSVYPVGDPREAITMTLRSEQGGQKFGLSSVNRTDDDDSQRYLNQFLTTESSIPNADLNFGKIASWQDKYVFWDRQLDPGYKDGGSPESITECGGKVTDASPDNRCGGASGFRSFGFFGIRNYYKGEAPYSPSGAKPDGFPGNETALFTDGAYSTEILFCNPSSQLQYLYDVDQWDNSTYTTNSSAIPPYNGLPYPNIHDGDKVAAPLYMGLKEGTKTDLVEIHPSCDLGKLQDPLTNWNGEFRVANGAYGSVQPAELFPVGGSQAGTFGEIEWSIPRMYQVSMMVPFGESQLDLDTYNDIRTATIDDPTEGGVMGNYGCSALDQSPDYYMDYQPAGEVVFGLYQTVMGAFNFEPIPTSGKNSILNYMPHTPIYWANDLSQLEPNLGGENVVGQRYNTRFDPWATAPGDPYYPHHYWPDLNRVLSQKASCDGFRNSNGTADIPPLMQLQNGANTFYQWNNHHGEWKLYSRSPNTDTNPSKTKYTGEGFWKVNPDVGGLYNATDERNILDYLFYVGGIDPTTRLGNTNNLQRFFMNPIAPTVNNNSPEANQVAKAFLSAGFMQDPVNKPQQPWTGPHEYGNGMPGGRYIVTVRATDRNGSADGMYTEFEVPVYLPWWATRNNCPLLASKKS